MTEELDNKHHLTVEELLAEFRCLHANEKRKIAAIRVRKERCQLIDFHTMDFAS